MMFHLIAASLVSFLILQAPTPGRGMGRIEGEVIDADSRIPIAGARVKVGLLRHVPNGVVVSAHAEEVITDEKGHFAFAGIPPGHCQIVIERNGYAWPPDGSEVQRFHVKAGQTTAGVEIALKRAGNVTGRIFDPRGEPIARTVVRALKFTGGEQAIEMAAAQTNDDGEFRFDSLSQGRYLIAAAGRGPTPLPDSDAVGITAFAPTYYPGTTDPDVAQPVFVTSGQTITGVQFSMLSAPAFQVSGVVVDMTGNPVSGAVVMLMPADGPSFARMIAQAADDGTFRIRGVMAGRYRGSASARSVRIEDGFGGISVAPISDGRSVRFEPIDLILDRSDVADLRLVLPARN